MHQESLGSLGWADLMRRLANNLASILDKQIDLVKEEVRENMSQTVRGAAILIVGGVLLLIALICFVVAGIFALSRVMDDRLAALFVGIVFLIFGAALALIGRARLQMKPLEKTRESFREDVEWVRRQPISSER